MGTPGNLVTNYAVDGSLVSSSTGAHIGDVQTVPPLTRDGFDNTLITIGTLTGVGAIPAYAYNQVKNVHASEQVAQVVVGRIQADGGVRQHREEGDDPRAGEQLQHHVGDGEQAEGRGDGHILQIDDDQRRDGDHRRHLQRNLPGLGTHAAGTEAG